MTFDLNSMIESFATEKALLINDLAGELNIFLLINILEMRLKS